MKKVFRISEENLVRLIKRVISEQTNPDILASLKEMGFGKENCPTYDPKSDKINFQYCHQKNPKIVIQYRDNGLELLDLMNEKILGSWENFNTDDIIDLESTVKNIFPIDLSEEILDYTEKEKRMINNSEPSLITVRRYNKEKKSVKSLIFFEYIFEDDILYLANPEIEIGVYYNRELGMFEDAYNDKFIYEPLNNNAKELFRELI